MRVFLDTNVLVSGLMGHGLCRDLLDRTIIEHTVLLGAPVHDELHRILTTKFHVPDALWRQLDLRLQDFEQAPATTAQIPLDISDHDDIPVLACALAANADVFVTGDKVLLEIGKLDDMPVLSPREFWEELGNFQS